MPLRFTSMLALFTAIACGGETSDVSTAQQPPLEKELPERPSNTHRWLATEHSLVQFDQLLAPLVTRLSEPDELVGAPAWSPDGTRLAHCRWSAQDTWEVRVLRPPELLKPEATFADINVVPGAKRYNPIVPLLRWVGNNRLLVTFSSDPTGRVYWLDIDSAQQAQLDNTSTDSGSVYYGQPSGSNFGALLIARDLSAVFFLGTSGEPVPLQGYAPNYDLKLSPDAKRLAVIGAGALPDVRVDSLIIDNVKWANAFAANCPHVDSPSCMLGSLAQLEDVAWSPDGSKLALQAKRYDPNQAIDKTSVSFASTSAPIEISSIYEQETVSSYKHRHWGFTPSNHLYFMELLRDGIDAAGDSVGARFEWRLVNWDGLVSASTRSWLSDFVVSTDQSLAYVASLLVDGTSHLVSLPLNSEALANAQPELRFSAPARHEIFGLFPNPAKSELLIGLQPDQDNCVLGEWNTCVNATFALYEAATQRVTLLPEKLTFPSWTPDGEGLIARQSGALVYLPHDAVADVYELQSPGDGAFFLPPSFPALD